MEEQGSHRFAIPTGWWDHYFVRYFVGTIVGAIIVLYLTGRLACRIGVPHLSLVNGLVSVACDSKGNLIEALLQISKEVGYKTWIAILGLGLAYCYIASAPMMILHATRAQLFGKDRKFSCIYWLFLAATFLLLAIGILARFGWEKGCAYIPLACVLIPQIVLLVSAHWQNFDSIRFFYKDLGVARAQELTGSDYVDSYRHLREHSNAYSIIALEFVFGFVLLSVPPSPRDLAIVVVLWVLPAAYCWLIATVLENAFTYPPP